MAGGVNRKISAASARAHTRKSNQSTSFKLPPSIVKKLLAVFFVGILAWIYQVIQPPPPKICGSPNGPPVTAPRIKLKDGRYLAYKEHGVPRDVAVYKIIYVHGFKSGRLNAVVATTLSPKVIEELGVYIVSFDRPGYGESDPNPKQTVKSMAMDIEELADQLGLGSKFYVIGYSMGGLVIWSCLKYIPNRLAGAILLAPAVNYWWPRFPANVSNEAFNQKLTQDRWVSRVAHYAPWLLYWWNTQKLFPASSVLAGNSDILSSQDKEITSHISARKDFAVCISPHKGDVFPFFTSFMLYESARKALSVIVCISSGRFSLVRLNVGIYGAGCGLFILIEVSVFVTCIRDIFGHGYAI